MGQDILSKKTRKLKRSLKTPFFQKGYSYLIPASAVLFVVSIYPLLYSLWLATHRYVAIIAGRPFVGAENFRTLVITNDFINSLRVSSIYVSVDVVGSFFLGLVLALILNENFRGNRFLRAIFIAPLTIAPIVAGFTWRFMLDSDMGLIGSFLLPAIGVNVKAILGDPTNAFISIVVADIWAKTPLMFLILLAGLQAIPQELYDAAKVDGASSFRQFLHVTLPSLAPAIVIALMLKIIDGVNAFDQIWVMTAGGPGAATQVLALLGVRIGFLYFNFGQAAALGWIMVAASMACTILLIKYLVK